MPWSDDDLDDREYPDEDNDDNDDDETSTGECPRCGALVYEDAEQCLLCGTWLTADTNPWTGRARWWVALGLLGIFALIVVLALGGL